VMSPVGSNLRKLSTGAQLQTFPYTTATKYFMYSKLFCFSDDLLRCCARLRDRLL